MWQRTVMIAAIAMGAGVPAYCQGSKLDVGNQGRNFDFASAISTRPVKTGTVLPALCNVGELFYKTDAAPGANLYGCTATNTWTAQAGGGGGGGGGLSAVTSSDGSILPVTSGGSADLTVNSAVVATATANSDLAGANRVGIGANGFVSVTIPNEGTVGTTTNRIAMLSGASSTARIATITTTTGMLGVVISGDGTTGNARIAVLGFANCDFDGPTTGGDYVQASTSVSGECHDAGAMRPTSGQVLGIVTSTNGSTGSYSVLLIPAP